MTLSCLQMKSLPPGVASDLRNAMNFCSIARVSAGERCALATAPEIACKGCRLVSYCHLAAWARRSSILAVCACRKGDRRIIAAIRIALVLIVIIFRLPVLQTPWTPHRARKPAVCVRIVLELLRDGVPLQPAAQTQRDVFLLDYGLGTHGAFDIADRLLATANGVQQVPAMIVAADHLDLVWSDLFSRKRWWIGYDSIAADENPTFGPVDHGGAVRGKRAELRRSLPCSHHVHVNQADTIRVFVLHRVFVRHIADIGIERSGTFHFNWACVIGIGDPLCDVDIVNAPGAIETPQSVIADKQPGRNRDPHIRIRRPGCRA